MKNSLSLLSVCVLFLALGVSSCKKDYVCHCDFESQGIDDYWVTFNMTKSKAKDNCQGHELSYPTVEVKCVIVN